MKNLHPVNELGWRELPSEMLDVLVSSPDFALPEPGEPPRRLHISSDNRDAELVIYRAARDDKLYVLAPENRHLIPGDG